MFKDMYKLVGDVVTKYLWEKYGVLRDVIVGIKLYYGDDFYTSDLCLLLFDDPLDIDSPSEWVDDWYEGQNKVIITSITPICELNIPESLNIEL